MKLVSFWGNCSNRGRTGIISSFPNHRTWEAMAFSHSAPEPTIMEPSQKVTGQILLLSFRSFCIIMLGKLWPLSIVLKSCQALWAPFPEGKLYILNQGQKHIMLEAFLEEGFLCPEIIFTACLICPLKMLDPLCGVCLLEADGLQTSLSGSSVFQWSRYCQLGESCLLESPRSPPNNDNIHLSQKDSISICYELSPP